MQDMIVFPFYRFRLYKLLQRIVGKHPLNPMPDASKNTVHQTRV
jgi:hypothetical protein